ncbi:23S rRNA methyltransferase [Colwellia sp. MT41]|uniref:Ribosomal RNA large subunit methyltransferase F n=1 Tax=Colwellia marinimaniae TaxID=1513592 RepID=A0ABQ0MS95_9GAMM|nr:MULTISPECIES: 23S rRNA (adenine(1618)-N(6))-methyltransferase RlmF [Colwellia]ALO34999.1 23S rRNA methyltransferase [Colwellia sp. MT41]GAW95241.1 ribosomal RNA large subunit methyltransferase F [Colwellia marinimaniae]
MHKNNRHKQGYNFTVLVKKHPELSPFIIKNKYNNQDTIDFANPLAIKVLNAALLKSDYHISFWDIPDGYLCPAVPGRVDYIHHLHDLLTATATTRLVAKKPVKVLDIGTGASCIYPILGQRAYGWHFVASDIDPISIKVAKQIISADKTLNQAISCRLQPNSNHIFNGIIAEDEFYHLTLCNPPFHRSLAEASQGTRRKWQNLNKASTPSKKQTEKLNFGGQKAELWCPGGELAFIDKMIKESKNYQQQVLWFTCLVSKKEHLSKLKFYLKKAQVKQIKVIKMAQGQKISRFIAWSFYDIS